jgi:hypothetical protein
MDSPKVSTFHLPQIRYWRELSIFAIMLMELSWIVPWFRSLTPETYAVSILRVFVVLWGIILLSNLTTRALNFLDIKINIRRGVILGLLVLCVFLGLKLLLYETESLTIGELLNRPFRSFNDVRGLIPDEFLVTIVVMLVFWRGMSLATKYIDPISVRRNFFIGVGMFTAFIFVNTLVTGETPGFMLYLFFMSALLALGSARIFAITQLRGGVINPFNFRWFSGIFFTSLAIVGLAGLITWFLSGRTSIVESIGSIVLGIFALIMLAIISPLIYFFERIANSTPNLSNTAQSLFDALEDLRNTFGGIASNLFNLLDIPRLISWLQLMKPVLMWGFVIAIALIILYSVSRWFLDSRDSGRDELESIIERGDLMRLIRKVVQNQLHKLGQSLRNRSQFRRGQRWLAAAKIRRIYAQLLDLTKKLGNPRSPAQTPLEYLPILEGIFPTGKEEVATITQAYLRVRYGELPETSQEVKIVESAWERVHTLGKEKTSQMSKDMKATTLRGN